MMNGVGTTFHGSSRYRPNHCALVTSWLSTTQGASSGREALELIFLA
jgi:hypothetical protein